MGQQFSTIVPDKKRANELQHVYDTSLALMIVNLMICFLPIAGFYWIEVAGVWIQVALSLITTIFSVIIYRLSKKYMADLNVGLNRAHLSMAILALIISIVGASVATSGWTQYYQCKTDFSIKQAKYYEELAKYNEDYSKWYNTYGYNYYYGSYYTTYSTSSSSSGSVSSASSSVYVSPPVAPMYPQEDCYRYYPLISYWYYGYSGSGSSITPGLAINEITLTILQFITMVLMSIQCGQLWNTAIDLAYESKRKMGLSHSSSTTNMLASVRVDQPQQNVVIPASMNAAFQQWVATQPVLVNQASSFNSLPQYQPPASK